MNFSNPEKYKIFLQTKVGFEFEFFSDIEEKNLAKILREKIGKKISLGYGKFGVKKEIGYHTETVYSEDIFKLEKDFSGGPMMYELITGPLDYFEAKKVLIKTLKTIHEVGWTNNNSSIHMNISFTNPECQIMFINILKFCLNFYRLEASLFKDFPSRKNNIYTESITKILPDVSSLTFNPTEYSIFNTKIKLPVDSRYFGVNFQKMTKQNYLEFRYIGGKDYVRKIDKISEYLEKFVLFSFDQAVNREITEQDEERFDIVIAAYYERMKFFKNIEVFKKKFPDITIMVDLKTEPELINIRYDKIREVLYYLVVNNEMRKGYLNYDSDLNLFQIKDSVIKKGVQLSNIEFVDCEISGNFERCNFYSCKINNSMIFDSELVGWCEVENSKVIDTKSSNTQSQFTNCFIRNDNVRIGGDFKNCIIVGSENRILQGSEIDKDCLFVDKEYGSKKKK